MEIMDFIIWIFWGGWHLFRCIPFVCHEIIGAYENLQFDETPTAGSTKAVTRGGVYEALTNIENIFVTDSQSDGNIVISFV